MTKLKTILIQFAMLEEAMSLINELNFVKETSENNDSLFDAYKKNLNEINLYLIIPKKCCKHNVPRVGFPTASLVAWEAINLLQPGLILNLGTAGGISSKDAKIGDIYWAEKAFYHDRNFHPNNISFRKHSCGGFPLFCNKKWQSEIGIKSGIVSSGNRMLLIEEDAKQLAENNAAIKEMEAAPIAEVAEIKKVPIIILKAVTDLIDVNSCSQEQFEQNFSLAVDNLTILF